MDHANHRRHFLRTVGAFGATVAFSNSMSRWVAAQPTSFADDALDKLGWCLSCSLYTFRGMTCYEALDKIVELGMRAIEPAFFLALRKDRPDAKTSEALSPELRREWQQELEKRGMRMVNFYANVAGDPAANRKIFEFARELKVQTLVAEPPPEALDGIEKLCNEFQINLAIHNHPKAPNYSNWDPANVARLCKGRSKRIGACCDTGHWVRSGLNTVECLKTMEGRILTVHLKDVIEAGKPEARDVPLGAGKADMGGVLRELQRQGFRGAMSIEYEYESPQLIEDVAQCVSFVKQTAAKL